MGTASLPVMILNTKTNLVCAYLQFNLGHNSQLKEYKIYIDILGPDRLFGIVLYIVYAYIQFLLYYDAYNTFIIVCVSVCHY